MSDPSPADDLKESVEKVLSQCGLNDPCLAEAILDVVKFLPKLKRVCLVEKRDTTRELRDDLEVFGAKLREADGGYLVNWDDVRDGFKLAWGKYVAESLNGELGAYENIPRTDISSYLHEFLYCLQVGLNTAATRAENQLPANISGRRPRTPRNVLVRSLADVFISKGHVPTSYPKGPFAKVFAVIWSQVGDTKLGDEGIRSAIDAGLAPTLSK